MSHAIRALNQHSADGDKKAAREKLRGTLEGNAQQSRSFRSGLYVGLGIPALSRALYLSNMRSIHLLTLTDSVILGFQKGTRKAIPAWAVLLQIYGGFLLPLALALLVGGNMLQWKRHRINYVFIFGKLAQVAVVSIF